MENGTFAPGDQLYNSLDFQGTLQCRTESFEIFFAVASFLAFCFARFPGAALAGPQAFESTQCQAVLDAKGAATKH